MLKTNSKAVKNYFRSLVIQSLEVEDVENYVKGYNDNTYYDYNPCYVNLADFIIQYHAGHGLISCAYDDMRKQIKVALEETEEQANKYDDIDVYRLYIYLVERAIVDVFKLKLGCKLNKYGKYYATYHFEDEEPSKSALPF